MKRTIWALFAVAAALSTTGPASAAAARWTIVPTASPSAIDSTLNGVVLTRSGGWAVGYQQVAVLHPRTLIERWSGRTGSWTRVASPNVAGTDSTLQAVTGKDGDAWAVGASGADTSRRPLALHWNGSSWHIVATPVLPGATLTGVVMLAHADVWAVGEEASAANPNPPVPMSMHWNGSRWSAVSVPVPAPAKYPIGPTASIRAVTNLPGTPTLIAVGTANMVGRGSGSGFVERWNGRRWSVMTLPAIGDGVFSLNGVAATSPTNAWAVGTTDGTAPSTVVLHWNGRSWARQSAPDPGQGQLSAIAASSGKSAWAVGAQQPAGKSWPTPFTLHWNGSAWSAVRAPAAPTGTPPTSCPGGGVFYSGYQGLNAVAIAPGTTQAASVGYHDIEQCNGPRRTLAERYA